MRTLPQALGSLQYDDRPGYTNHGRTVTWSQVVTESSRRSEILRNFLEPAPSIRIGIMIDDSPENLFWTAGAVQSGASVIGLDKRGSRRPEHLAAAASTCSALVSDEPGLDFLDSLGIDVACTIDLTTANYLTLVDQPMPSSVEPGQSWDSSALFSFVDDSASTIDVRADRATRAAHDVMRATEMTRYDICYDPLPLNHENSMVGCWAPAVMAGSELVLQQEYTAEKFLGDVRDFNCTYFSFAGTMIADLLDLPPTDLDNDHRLRIGFGTDSTPHERLEFAQRYGCPLIDATQWHSNLMFGQ